MITLQNERPDHQNVYDTSVSDPDRIEIGPFETMYYCYVLRCSDGTFYTGITTDLTRRLEEHNQGHGCRYTSSRRPVRLVWKEPHPNRSSAQRREAEIKRWSRSKKRTLIEDAGARRTLT